MRVIKWIASSIARGKLSIKLTVAGILLMTIAGGGFLFMQHKPDIAASANEESEPEPETTLLALDEFVVNLAGSSQSHYLSVTITLEVTQAEHEEDAEPQEPAHGSHGDEAEAPDELTPQLRDAIIEVLTLQTYQSLRTQEGRVELKNAIKKSINAKVNDIRVVNVLFSTFVMQ